MGLATPCHPTFLQLFEIEVQLVLSHNPFFAQALAVRQMASRLTSACFGTQRSSLFLTSFLFGTIVAQLNAEDLLL